MALALHDSRDPPAVRCRCRVRLDLRGPTPTHSFRTSGGTTLTVGPALLVLPDPCTALALFEAACRAAQVALPRLPAGEYPADPLRWPMHAAVLLHPQTIAYRVFGGSVSSTHSPVVVLTLGALRLCCHDRASLRDVLAGAAGAYHVAHVGLKAPTAQAVALTIARHG